MPTDRHIRLSPNIKIGNMKCFIYLVVDDDIYEADETFTISIPGAGNSNFNVTIRDNEGWFDLLKRYVQIISSI